jgi:hypothetical protein
MHGISLKRMGAINPFCKGSRGVIKISAVSMNSRGLVEIEGFDPAVSMTPLDPL